MITKTFFKYQLPIPTSVTYRYRDIIIIKTRNLYQFLYQKEYNNGKWVNNLIKKYELYDTSDYIFFDSGIDLNIATIDWLCRKVWANNLKAYILHLYIRDIVNNKYIKELANQLAQIGPVFKE